MGCGASKKKGDKKGDSEPSRASTNSKIIEEDAFSRGKIEEFYMIGEEVGRGAFSVVRGAIHKQTNVKFAIKSIDKKYVDNDDILLLKREIDIMKKVSHDNILKLKEIFETPSHLYLVMEFVSGGELFYKIVERGSYSERDASKIICQLVNGVKYLHSLGIAHRDIKPENLLCSGDGENMTIKISDFGLSKIFSGGEQLETACGTPDYAAPEVLMGESSYDKSVDMWSVGVVTYVLLCGYPPFYAQTQPALFEKITHARYTFPDPEWSNVSDVAKDFIRHLLVLDSSKRLTAEECLQHPFLAGAASEKDLNLQNTIRDYNKERKKALAKNVF